jgi:hypothetical protein
MKSFSLFAHFVKESSAEVFVNKHVYLTAFVALVLLGNTETLWPILGVPAESTTSIVLSVVTALLTFVVLAQIVLIQKKKHGGSGELSFIVPTFLLYNIYYTAVFFAALVIPVSLFYFPFVAFKLNTHLAGLIAFYVLVALSVIGAFFMNILFFMVPLIAVLDDEVARKFFKESSNLTRKNFKLVAWIAIVSLLVEFSFLAFSFIQEPLMKALATFAYSIPDAYFTLVLTVAMVKIFYYLKNATA